MITKRIIEALIAEDPEYRDRFREIGLLSYAEKKGAPSATGFADASLSGYIEMFKKKEALLLRIDNGTLVTYIVVAVKDRDSEAVAYTSRKKFPVLIIKGRSTNLYEENAPSIAKIVQAEMLGKEDPAWMQAGVIQMLSILPPGKAKADNFSKLYGHIAVNVDFSRPFDIKKSSLKIKQWPKLVVGVIKSLHT